MFFPTAPWVFASDLKGPMFTAPESNVAWNIHEWTLK
jgi:hypothetical protein